MIQIALFIEKNNLQTKYLHFSMSKIENVYDGSNGSWQESDKSIYYNPNGLWISVGNSWLEYVDNNIKKPSPFNLFSYIYEIEISKSVLIINSKDELIQFIKNFKNDDNIIKIYNVINWKKVKSVYDGMIILDKNIFDNSTKDKMIINGSDSVQNFIESLFGQNSWKDNYVLLSEWIRH